MKTKHDRTLKNGIVPAGYKETVVGVIPEHWRMTRLSTYNLSLESGVSVNSQDFPKQNGQYGILKTSAVANGAFNANENKRISDPKELKRARLNPTEDQLLISRMNTPELVGACAYVGKTIPDLFIPDRLWLAQFDPAYINAKWLNYLLNSNHYKVQLRNRASGTSNSMKNISKDSFLGIPIPLPPLPEQRKIATILSTWDQAIEKTQKLIDQLKQRNKGLAQQLLTGKKRLKGFKGEWRHESLGMYFKERKEFGYENLPLLSVGESGVYHQSESNKKDTSNEDKASYKRICVGDIGYNTMRMWQGRSALSAFEGIVSPAYTVVTPRPNADAQFFSYLFKLQAVIHKFYRNSQGLVSDTLNCKFKDFKIVKVDVPPSIMEQKAVASLLDLASDEMRLYTKRLTSLQRQKKGLMQRLLTGEIRVKLKS